MSRRLPFRRASLLQLKENPSRIIRSVRRRLISLHDRKRTVGYLVSVDTWEALQEQLDDATLCKLVMERNDEPREKVEIADL